MSGASTFSVTYSNSSKPVFGAAGPSMNDIDQGDLGDCYLLSCLAEVAYKNPNVISSMIASNGNVSYGVHFYISGTPQYVTVNTSLANGGGIFNSGTNIWASLVEKGYAQLQAGGVYTGNSINYGNSWSTIGNGGAPEFALEEITNSPIINDFRASGSAWTSVTYNSSLATIGYSTGNATAAVQNTLIADLAAGDDVILSSWTNARDSSGKTTLVASHAMSIYGFDSDTRMFQIRKLCASSSAKWLGQSCSDVSLFGWEPFLRSLIVTTDASRKSLSGPAYSKEPVSLFGLNGRFFAPAWAQKGAARRGCQDGPEAHAKRLGLDSPEHGAMLTAGWGIHNSGARFPLSFPALGSWFFPGSAKAAATWLPGPVPLCPGRDHP